MNTQYVSPKLLLEFYKGEKVPPLIKKYDFQSKFQQRPIRQRNNHNNPHQNKYQHRNPQQMQSEAMQDLDKQLQLQIQENRELRLIIKQLQEKLEKLKQINEQLVQRLQQIERRNASLSQNSQNLKKVVTNKIRAQTYQQVQNYIKILIQDFTESLLNTKMSPIVEGKLQTFLQQILNVNRQSIRLSLNPSQKQRRSRVLLDESQADKTIKQIIQRNSKSKQKSNQRRRSAQRQKYQQVINKLNNFQGSNFDVEKSFITPSQISNQSPNKWKSQGKRRTRIFNKLNQSVSKSPYKPQNKIDF